MTGGSGRQEFHLMTDRIKIICSRCRKVFRERAPRIRNGYQMQCPYCMKLITFDSSSEDPNARRALKAARDFRLAAEEAIVLARLAQSHEPQHSDQAGGRSGSGPMPSTEKSVASMPVSSGSMMFARIGVMRGLNRHVERVFNPSRGRCVRI
jgi:DNA-directed RNA polymerase subunit RPC12/RpoP